MTQWIWLLDSVKWPIQNDLFCCGFPGYEHCSFLPSSDECKHIEVFTLATGHVQGLQPLNMEWLGEYRMQSRLRLTLSSIIYMITGTITVKNYNVIVMSIAHKPAIVYFVVKQYQTITPCVWLSYNILYSCIYGLPILVPSLYITYVHRHWSL